MGLLPVVMAKGRGGSGGRVAECIVSVFSDEASATVLRYYKGLVVKALVGLQMVHTAPSQARHIFQD